MALPGLIAANNLSDVVDIEKTWDNVGENISTTVTVASPSLDLNFATNKNLIDGVSGNNLIAFNRASTGTFVGANGLIQTAASGVPRFDHNPITGESLGLLVEEARTNLLVRSEELDNAIWVKNAALVTPNAAVAPDGTITADKLIENTINSNHRADQSVTYAASTTYTISFFVKAAERFRGLIALDTGVVVFPAATSAAFNLSTKTITVVGTGASASITELSNGWFRLSLTATSSAGGFSTTPGIRVYNDAGTNTYLGDGISGFYVWGAQLEVGAFPTSYIPTTTTTVTRAADVATITGTNFSSFYNSTEGTVFVRAGVNRTFDTSRCLLEIGDGSNSNRLFVGNSFTSSSSLSQVYSANILQASFGVINAFSTGVANNGLAYKLNNFALTANGTVPVVDTSGTVPVVSALYIGKAGSTASINWCGTIARLTYYPVRLGNITLQALTTYGPVSSFPYSFSIKGRDILALKEVNKTSTRNLIFIKGLTAPAQPRITIANQNTISGVLLEQNALLKASPSSIGNYSIRSVLAANALRVNGNNVGSLSLSPFSATVATAPLSVFSLGLGSDLRWSPAMPSGAISSPEIAIPIDFSSFVLYAKAGQS